MNVLKSRFFEKIDFKKVSALPNKYPIIFKRHMKTREKHVGKRISV
jgi:hypothetical protein